MSFVMIKPSQLSPPAFALYQMQRPCGIAAVAGLPQPHVQKRPNLWNRQRRCILFSPAVFPKSKTIVR